MAKTNPNAYYHEVPVKIINDSTNPNPKYAHPGDAGMDLYASETKMIPAGGIAMVPTSIRISLPDGYEAQIRSRSGLAAKSGIFVLNSPGTIDSQYQGHIGVILANFGTSDFIVNYGDRIAQMVIAKYEKASLTEVSEFANLTERGENGFGSSGV